MYVWYVLTLAPSPSWRTGTTPHFPEQFSANLKVTAHTVDRTKAYPPSMRQMDILYDRVAGRAKVVLNDGLNPRKTFLRLYESKSEYMIQEGEYPSCRRSYVGERSTAPWLRRLCSMPIAPCTQLS